MGLTAHVLAIDAGNSKTDVAVIGADGTVLGHARGGGFQPPVVGVDVAVDALGTAVLAAFAQAGVVGVEHVSACLANADLPVEERELAGALVARGWAGRWRCATTPSRYCARGWTSPAGWPWCAARGSTASG